MNTKLSYMYRDANNYKQWEEIVFAGVLKDEEKLKKIKFIDGEFFIPGKVDLPDLQERFCAEDPEADHAWHEWHGIETTEEDPKDSRDINDFIDQMIAIDWEDSKLESYSWL